MGCCSFVTDFIDDAVDFITDDVVGFIEDFADGAYDLIKSVWSQVWDNVLEPIVEPIFGLLGFEDETIINTQIQSVRLLIDLPLSRLTSNIIGSMDTNNDTANIVLYTNLTGASKNIERFIKNAQTKYIYGVPNSTLYNNIFSSSAVDSVLTTIEGVPITVSSSFVAKPTSYDWAKWWMQENEPLYDYNANTIFLTPTTWDVVGAVINGAGTEITVNLLDGVTPSTYGPITALPNSGLYYIVDYVIDSAPTVTINWLYEEALGTHPTLDLPFGFTGTNTSSVIPIVPIRLAKRNINSTPETAEYKTTRDLLKLVKFDIDVVTDGITKQPDGNGVLIPAPNIDAVNDIFIFFGVSLYAESTTEKFMLYNTFNSIASGAKVTKTIYDDAVAAADTQLPINTFTIKSPSFNYALTFNYISKTDVAGIVAPVGKHDVIYVELPNVSNLFGGNVQSYVLIRHQYSPTHFTELHVDGVHLVHVISTVAGNAVTAIHVEDHAPGAALTTNQTNFLIPVSSELFDAFTPNQADVFFAKSAYVLVYAAEIVELEWYQTSSFLNFFSLVIKFVALVMYLFDWSGSATEALWALAEFLLISYAFEFVLRKLFIKYADDPAALAIISILAVVGTVLLPGTQFNELSTASQLMAGVQAVSSVTNLYVAGQFELLAKEQAEFSSVVDAFEQELQEAQDFLTVRSVLTPNVLLSRSEYKYETSDDFYRRTLNTAPGQLVFDQLHDYVDNNLNIDYI